MPKYYLEHYGFVGDEENSLMHYGIKGMRWRHHKVKPGMGDHDRAEYYRTQGEKRNHHNEVVNRSRNYTAREKAERVYDHIERGGGDDPWSTLKRASRIQNLASNEQKLTDKGVGVVFRSSDDGRGNRSHSTTAVYTNPNNPADSAIVSASNRFAKKKKDSRSKHGVTLSSGHYNRREGRR